MNYKWLLIKENRDRDGMTGLMCQKEEESVNLKFYIQWKLSFKNECEIDILTETNTKTSSPANCATRNAKSLEAK